MADSNHFVALSECHFMNPGTLAEINYYPDCQRWWDSVDGVMRAWSGRDLTGEWPPPPGGRADQVHGRGRGRRLFRPA